MRRRDREITSRDEIDAVIRAAEVCRIAFADHNEPYVVPVSFGYDGETLYIHTARTGRKLDFIAANNRVCFELEANVSIQSDEHDACAWTFEFESVIGYGTITELETPDDKARGLNQIMLQPRECGESISKLSPASDRPRNLWPDPRPMRDTGCSMLDARCSMQQNDRTTTRCVQGWVGGSSIQYPMKKTPAEGRGHS
jgi:nitroimidazol reductase NimA-like FMN-containing flavoprotein (pyridoxamine 5'-phosphate oxidase superfamily)